MNTKSYTITVANGNLKKWSVLIIALCSVMFLWAWGWLLAEDYVKHLADPPKYYDYIDTGFLYLVAFMVGIGLILFYKYLFLKATEFIVSDEGVDGLWSTRPFLCGTLTKKIKWEEIKEYKELKPYTWKGFAIETYANKNYSFSWPVWMVRP